MPAFLIHPLVPRLMQVGCEAIQVPQRGPQIVGDGVGKSFQFFVASGQFLRSCFQVQVQIVNFVFYLLPPSDVPDCGRD